MGVITMDKVIRAVEKLYPTILPTTAGKGPFGSANPKKAVHYVQVLVNDANNASVLASSRGASGGGGSASGGEEGDPGMSESDQIKVFMSDTTVAAAVTLLLDAMDEPADGCNFYQEDDMAYALMTWKDNQAAKNEIMKSRGFDDKFQLDFTRLARKVLCWNCGKEGHFSRNCKAPARTMDAGSRMMPKGGFGKGDKSSKGDKGAGKGKKGKKNFYNDRSDTGKGDGYSPFDPEAQYFCVGTKGSVSVFMNSRASSDDHELLHRLWGAVEQEDRATLHGIKSLRERFKTPCMG
jgi:hypothetical protein